MNAPRYSSPPFCSFANIQVPSDAVGPPTRNPFSLNVEQSQRWYIRDGNWRFSLDIFDSAGTGDPASSGYTDQEPDPDTQDTWAKRTAHGYGPVGYGKDLPMTDFDNPPDPLPDPFHVEFSLAPQIPAFNSDVWWPPFQITGTMYAHWDLTDGGGFPGSAYMDFTTFVPPAETDNYVFYTTVTLDDQAGGTFDLDVYRFKAGAPDVDPAYSYDEFYEMTMAIKPTTYLTS